MTFANIITIARIILVPVFLVVLLTELENKEIFAFSIFIIASISDVLDGYIARKYDQITDLGKFLDPLADKLLISGALISLVAIGSVETWVASLIILREIFITSFRYYSLTKDAVFSASFIAKKKTFFQIFAISTLIIFNIFPKPYNDYLFNFGTYLLYFALFLTIYSGIEYIIKHAKLIKKD